MILFILYEKWMTFLESDFKNELYTLIYTLILIRDHNLKIYYIQMGGRHSRGGVEGVEGVDM